ncbi:MAG: hypothetical protein ACI4OT_00285 [Bacilli bacterium]
MKKLVILFSITVSIFLMNNVKATSGTSFFNYSYFDNLSNSNLIFLDNYFKDYYSSLDTFIFCNIDKDLTTIFCLNQGKYNKYIQINSSSNGSATYTLTSIYNNSPAIKYDKFSYDYNTNEIYFINQYSVYDYDFLWYVSSYISSFPFSNILWANGIYKSNELFNFLNIGEDFYIDFDVSPSDRYLAHYSYSHFICYDCYLYSVVDRVIGSTTYYDFNYSVRYYFNDILDPTFNQEYTYTGFNGDQVNIDNLESSINGYDLDTTREYFYIAGGDNVVNVYYYNDMYKKQYYTINVYLDDIYYAKYSYTSYGDIDSLVELDLPSTLKDIYVLDDTDLNFIINESRELNNFTVNYYSEYYGTEYQQIDLSDSTFYLFFDYQDLEVIFPNLNLTHFTQFEQLVIIIGLNILFCVLLIFVIVIFYKLLQKLLAYFF